ncbi:substrate-binding domain-containing protein [Agathobaculum sp. NTUH-O15-33]|uniref:substrate-binding domain-containing protein n=1 Tax=Agathobaculum sp. NTUH-O15-33 TaxID=3079302 RepID=UPI002958C82D|nr:substrate-binding domain-containing protein [Agathobaculum sp. NTUH-O15-33]WNX85581.1 substrate-binding domain-containing protein [Agathobaculum sp. NTUH-O15-33]
MRMQKRLAGCVCLLAFTAALLAACLLRPQTAPVKTPVMGIVYTASEDDWKDEQFRLLGEQAEAHGFDRMVMQAMRTQQSQIDAIRALVVYRVDVIVFSPVVQSGWDNVLREAAEANIPVITVDKTVTQGDARAQVSYVGFPYRALAKQAAKRLLSEKNDTVAELYGTLNSSGAQEMSRGFREGMEQSGQELKYSLCGDFLRSRGYELMETFEQEYPHIGLVVSQNDAMVLGAVDYLKEHGLRPGTDIRICAFGGGEEVLGCLARGEINLVAVCDNQALAHETAHAALKLLEHPETPLWNEVRAELLPKEAA